MTQNPLKIAAFTRAMLNLPFEAVAVAGPNLGNDVEIDPQIVVHFAHTIATVWFIAMSAVTVVVAIAASRRLKICPFIAASGGIACVCAFVINSAWIMAFGMLTAAGAHMAECSGMCWKEVSGVWKLSPQIQEGEETPIRSQ